MNKITSHLDKKLAEIQNRANMAPTWSILAVDVELLMKIIRRQHEALKDIDREGCLHHVRIARQSISDIEKLIEGA